MKKTELILMASGIGLLMIVSAMKEKKIREEIEKEPSTRMASEDD